MATETLARHSARFGARYGVSVKKRFENVEQKQRKHHLCPKCGFEKVQRVSTGIFVCNKCNAKYAGGAFYPQTLSGSIIAKMVAQKAFTAQNASSLIEQVKEVDPVVEVESPSDEEKIDRMVRVDKPVRKKFKAQKEDLEADEAPASDDEDEQ